MFNRYYKTEYGGPSRVDVHEHRAPTDASAQMLREMEAEALKRVHRVHQIGENSFSATLIEMIPVSTSCEHELHVLFTLNGNEHTYVVRGIDAERYRRMDDGHGLVRLVAEKLAAEITLGLLRRLRVT